MSSDQNIPHAAAGCAACKWRRALMPAGVSAERHLSVRRRPGALHRDTVSLRRPGGGSLSSGIPNFWLPIGITSTSDAKTKSVFGISVPNFFVFSWYFIGILRTILLKFG